jgi:hypothetical protein
MAEFMGLFRGLAFAYIPSAVGIIPWVGGLVGRIWSIVAATVPYGRSIASRKARLWPQCSFLW